MIRSTKKIDDFVQQATSLHCINACAFVACVVFFLYLLWVSMSQSYPAIIHLYCAGAVLIFSFVLKLSMQSSASLRAGVSDSEYDILVLGLNLLALYLMLETIDSFSEHSAVFTFILTFLPGFLLTLLPSLLAQDSQDSNKTGQVKGFICFLQWTLAISVTVTALNMLATQAVNARYLSLLANLVVWSSPLLIRHLSERLKKQLKARFVDEMYRDPLTHIANRKCYYDHYDVWREKIAQDTSAGVFVLLADIDFFKQYNDHYGHEQGDSCLYDVAQALLKLSQQVSSAYSVELGVYRIGGEEFVFAGKMSHKDAQRVVNGAEFKAWSTGSWALDRAHHASPSGKVTLSGGADWLNADTVYRTNAAGATKIADGLLYEVKGGGRAWLKPSDSLKQEVHKAACVIPYTG